jgi:gamma-glutamyltranspeptidase/glutathione hydrolase
MTTPAPFTTRPQIEGIFGVVASTHWIATAIGMSMLERGGNAFDAAVATAFTLQVVEPHLNGPGGDVPIILYDARAGKPIVICGQGVAPRAATIARFRALGLQMVPGSGLLAACVPGTLETWMMMLRDFGTMRVRDVLEPAIFYAREGHPLVERETETIATVEALFHAHWKTSAAIYLPGGTVPTPGTLFRNLTLAATYERLLREAESVGSDRLRQIEQARRSWSHGFIAESIDAFCRSEEAMDTSGVPHRGLLTGDDIAAWSPHSEAPVAYDYGRFTVCKAGFWSQGPVLQQQLALLKASADFIHLQVECAKLAFADRDSFYGDPAFVAVPGEVLLSDVYNDERRRLVGDRASLELRPGNIPGCGGKVHVGETSGTRAAGAGEPTVGSLGSGEPTMGELGDARGDTVHFDIIDRWGNMISSTPSGGWLQSSPVIPELGFCLGTRAQMFWLDETHPAALAPGKRPRTTLSPTIAMRDGEPYLAWGTPGGDQQDQWTCQFLLRHAHAGHNLQQAIDAPAWHSEHFPSSFWPRAARPGVLLVEGRLSQATIEELRRRGHIVEVGPPWSEGRLTAASREGSRRKAAANPRGMQGYAAGR